MGLVSQLLESHKVAEGEKLRQNILTEGYSVYESFSESDCAFGKMEVYPKDDEVLTNLFSSAKESDHKKAALTCLMLKNQSRLMEGFIKQYGEATVVGALGALTPKIMDVVRIFYPNQVAHILTDIQPLTTQTGQIFIIKPRYANTAAGVTKGQEVFKNMTDGNYAAESSSMTLGTHNASLTVFAGILAGPVRKDGSLVIKRAGTQVAKDSGQVYGTNTNTFTGTDNGATVTVVINYETGQVTATWGTAQASGAVTVEWLVDSENNIGAIRQLEISLDMVPVRAQEHPLKMIWSVTAQMAASAHLGVDIPETLTNLGSQFVKVERDKQIIDKISATATADSSLNFNAAAVSGLAQWQVYQQIELKLNYGESAIQNANGHRGGVSWIIAGYNASDIWRQVRGFQSENVVSPIGAHKVGTLRDGTVDVIKAPFLNTNEYVVGFKGYMPGDSATILAEWIPMYFTPIFQSPNLQGERGLMSLYDLFVNNAGYYRKGTISSYTA